MTRKSKDEEGGGGGANLIDRLPVKLSANDRGHLNLVLIADEVWVGRVVKWATPPITNQPFASQPLSHVASDLHPC